MEKDVVVRERTEDYLGAIYRLRTAAESPLPLSALCEHFSLSPVSMAVTQLRLSHLGDIQAVLPHP